MTSIGENVRRIREQQGLSQAELARRVGRVMGRKFDPSHLSRIEGDEYKSPRMPLLQAIAKALDRNVWEVTGPQPAREPAIHETDPDLRELLEEIEMMDASERMLVIGAIRAVLNLQREWLHHETSLNSIREREETDLIQQIISARQGSTLTSPITTPQTPDEKIAQLSELSAAGTVLRGPWRAPARWTPEFPHTPPPSGDFNDNGDTDFPLDFHGYPLPGEVGGNFFDEDEMPFLHSKDVRGGNVRVVKVRVNATEQIRAGMIAGVDATKQNIALIEDGTPAVAYLKERGTFVGLLFHEPSRTILVRQDGETIDLSAWEFMGPVVQTWNPHLAKEPKPKGKKGGIS